jgi:stage V sporulation protein R
MSNMMSGSPILQGDNTIPGLKIHKEVAAVLPQIEAACKGMGLDYYPIIVEFVSYDEMSELASYGGFPVRYPHWRWGMEYEEMSRGYEYNQYRISEMIVNTNPAYIFCMDSNTLVDNVDVICHAIGHADFFKNNIYFTPTDGNMMNKLANHGARIRKYASRWGSEVVTRFIDDILRVQTLINPTNAWKHKKIKNTHLRDRRKYHFPKRLKTAHNYMDEWVNTKEFMAKQQEKIKDKEAAEYLDTFDRPEKDIFGYIKDHAPFKLWEQDIASMLYEEAMYFQPQRQTKALNEGFASWVDFHLLCREGLVSLGQDDVAAGIWHYAEHKMRVLGGKWSQNPYKLGFELLLDIEDRWNKGKFGKEYEECNDLKEKEKWDKQIGKGMEKVFEVREFYNDYTLLQEFLTQEFCEKMEYYEYRRFPNGEYRITDRDFESIKDQLLKRYLNGGLPDIRLADPNHLGKGWFLMQHYSNGLPLYERYVRETLISMRRLWQNTVVLVTANTDGEEFVYICDGVDPQTDVHVMPRDEYESNYIK